MGISDFPESPIDSQNGMLKKKSSNACIQINNLLQNFFHSIVACYDKTRCLRPSTTRLKANLFLCNKVRAFWNRKRKRKHWFIHFQISRHLILSIDCARIFSARVSIVKNRTFGKGPSIYYVSIILDFFVPTHYFRIKKCTERHQNLPFFEPTYAVKCLRSVWMVLNMAFTVQIFCYQLLRLLSINSFLAHSIFFHGFLVTPFTHITL